MQKKWWPFIIASFVCVSAFVASGATHEFGVPAECQSDLTVASAQPQSPDLYARLGVASTASEAEIKTAFRKAASEFHPDRPGTGNQELFLRIQEAWDTLKNPELRQAYDKSRQADQRNILLDVIFDTQKTMADKEQAFDALLSTEFASDSRVRGVLDQILFGEVDDLLSAGSREYVLRAARRNAVYPHLRTSLIDLIKENPANSAHFQGLAMQTLVLKEKTIPRFIFEIAAGANAQEALERRAEAVAALGKKPTDPRARMSLVAILSDIREHLKLRTLAIDALASVAEAPEVRSTLALLTRNPKDPLGADAKQILGH